MRLYSIRAKIIEEIPVKKNEGDKVVKTKTSIIQGLERSNRNILQLLTSKIITEQKWNKQNNDTLQLGRTDKLYEENKEKQSKPTNDMELDLQHSCTNFILYYFFLQSLRASLGVGGPLDNFQQECQLNQPQIDWN